MEYEKCDPGAWPTPMVEYSQRRRECKFHSVGKENCQSGLTPFDLGNYRLVTWFYRLARSEVSALRSGRSLG